MLSAHVCGLRRTSSYEPVQLAHGPALAIDAWVEVVIDRCTADESSGPGPVAGSAASHAVLLKENCAD
jgi:hypothetical protein